MTSAEIPSLARHRVPAFFLLVNASIFVAWIHYLSGRLVMIGKPHSGEIGARAAAMASSFR